MPVKVRIPAVLRKLTGNQEIVEADGAAVADVIADLERRYPGAKAKLCDDTGALRRFINIYLNGEDIRFLSGADTPVPDGAEISIVPSIAGG